MSKSPRTMGAVTIAAAVSTTLVNVAVPHALATPTGDNVVISEVYGGGGNKDATLTHDFIELYNPTDSDIDVTGWTADYIAASGNSGGKAALEGVVPAGGYFLIQQAKGNGGDTALPQPDVESGVAMSKSQGSVVLAGANGEQIDAVGYGAAAVEEGTAADATGSATSVSRDANGTDTDDNSADFTVGQPSPQNSRGETQAAATDEDDQSSEDDQSGEDTNTGDQTAPEGGTVDGLTAIADIQGTGDQSPLVGKTVTTRGVVTASYPEGGLNGYMIQTAGTGAEEKQAGDASDGIFVYSKDTESFPEIGTFVEVTGEVAEFFWDFLRD